jgi:hypothetical protein
MDAPRTPTPRLGIDIGRVVIDGASHPEGGDTAFFAGGIENALRTPPMAGLFEVVPRLVERFGGQAWLISKCGPRVAERSLAWLDYHRFHELTGLPAGNVRFCRRRPEKALICAELGITHMVDDRPDVHRALAGVVANRFAFGPQPGPLPPGVVHVLTWADVETVIHG